jgi:hypothetical protein
MPYRTVASDNTIVMLDDFDPDQTVELRRPGRKSIEVLGQVLNDLRATQRAAYKAEARPAEDGSGELEGPTGRRRESNELRNVDVSGLIEEADGEEPAA